VRCNPEHQRIANVAFSPEGTKVFWAHWQGTVRVWEWTASQEARSLRSRAGGVVWMTLNPDGSRLALAGAPRNLRVLDALEGHDVLGPATKTLQGHTTTIRGAAFSPDGGLLASASLDGTVRLWNTTTGDEARTLKGHASAVMAVTFSPDGSRLASASSDRTVKVWSVMTQAGARTLSGQARQVHSVAFSPDGSRLASAHRAGVVKIWDGRTGQEVFSLAHSSGDAIPQQGWEGAVVGVAFHPDGNRLASVGFDETVKVWDLTTHRVIYPFQGQPHPVGGNPEPPSPMRGVAFSPDGRFLALASADQTIHVWDLTTGSKAFTLLGHTAWVYSVVFSPDGKRLASASEDQSVRVWDLTTRQMVHLLQGHTASVLSVAFNPDGSRLASASHDTTIRIWDAGTGQEVRTLRGQAFVVRSVAFSRDGSRLASGSPDQIVRVWEVATGRLLLALRGHGLTVQSVVFSPDARLASGSYDTTVRVWDARFWTAEAAMEAALEREALGLLDFLFAKPLRKADVLEYLQSSTTIRPQARQLALSLLDRYREETDPEKYHQASWAIVRQPYLNAFQYRFALKQAAAACQMAPEQVKYQATLSMAQYRVGQKEQAQATLARLRETMQKPEWAKNEEAQSCLREAEALIEGQPTTLKK
jgi:WD40 repeat protein